MNNKQLNMLNSAIRLLEAADDEHGLEEDEEAALGFLYELRTSNADEVMEAIKEGVAP